MTYILNKISVGWVALYVLGPGMSWIRVKMTRFCYVYPELHCVDLFDLRIHYVWRSFGLGRYQVNGVIYCFHSETKTITNKSSIVHFLIQNFNTCIFVLNPLYLLYALHTPFFMLYPNIRNYFAVRSLYRYVYLVLVLSQLCKLKKCETISFHFWRLFHISYILKIMMYRYME